MLSAAQRLALPVAKHPRRRAGGWDQVTPFYPNQLQARKLPKNAQTPTTTLALGAHLPDLLSKSRAVPGKTHAEPRVVKAIGKPTKLDTHSTGWDGRTG